MNAKFFLVLAKLHDYCVFIRILIPVGEMLEQIIPNKERTIWNIHASTRAICKLKNFFFFLIA